MEIVKMAEHHCIGVIDMLNYYIENTGFTFIESKIPYRLFDPLITMLGGELSLVAEENGKVIGAVMFKRYSSMSFFKGVVEMGIYVRRDYHHKGVGRTMLEEAKKQLKEKNVRMICTTVSSLNEKSIAFHKAMGFREVGAYEDIGIYNGTEFSVIHFQLKLDK